MATRKGRPDRVRETASDPPPLGVGELRARKDALEQRLEDGFVKIAEGEASGRDVAAWEAFWVSLLREYEGICEELKGTVR